jgi:hypothetical protein
LGRSIKVVSNAGGGMNGGLMGDRMSAGSRLTGALS